MVETSRVSTTPTLSIVVPLYNAGKLLPRFFSGLERQSINPKLVEVLIVDGGSNDDTVRIAKAHHATVLSNPKRLAEPGVVAGFANAKGTLVMVMAADNIFKDSDALERMIGIFNDPSVAAAFPKHDTASDDSLYSRYINTFTDPYSHFIYQDASNARTFEKVYARMKHTHIYDVFDFQRSATKPLLALAQGFTVRRKEMKERLSDEFDDVLVIYDLIQRGKQIAHAHSVALYHYTIRDTADFIKKQRRAVENALIRSNAGITLRGRFLTAGQKIRAYLFFPYAFTIVFPLLQSVINAVRTKESAWLLHWYMSFLSAVILSTAALSLVFGRNHE